MKLKHWYNKNIVYPLLVAFTTIALLVTIGSTTQFNNEQIDRQKTLAEIVKLATLGLKQQDKALFEITLNMVVTNLKFNQVTVCDKSQVVYSFPKKIETCQPAKTDFFNSNLNIPGPDTNDFYFIFSYSWLGYLFLMFYPLLTLIILVISVVLIIRQFYTQLHFDILSPLSPQLINNSLVTKVDEINGIIDREKESEDIKLKSAVNEALNGMAAQVSHDIRSPLTALVMVTGQIENIPDNQRNMIRSSVQRITDISNELMQKSRQYKNQMQRIKSTEQESITAVNERSSYQVELLAPIIDSLVSEKRVQFRERKEVEIEGDINLAYGLFASINASEFKRVLSQLVTNSVESFDDGKGRVVIAIRGYNNRASIFVQDNGRGIPEEVLKHLDENGETNSHESTEVGSDLGLCNAKKTIEDFGGKFEILSREGVGTTISMHLDRAVAPKWFVECLKFYPNMQVISIDDDIAIHQIWKGRFESKRSQMVQVEHLTFTSGPEFKNWFQSESSPHEKANRIYLVDYELLNQNMTGLDIIEDLKIGAQSILVTSRYEEEKLRDRCEKLGVKLIPKSMAVCVPIELAKPKQKLDCILIDDDPLIEMAWEMVAKKKGKSFKYFSHPDELFEKISDYDFETPLYIDQYLGGNIKGDVVSKKFFDLGFKNIYLCTGADNEDFKNLNWIKQVRGKEPEF